MNNAGAWFLKGAWIELGLEQAVRQVIQSALQCYSAQAQHPLRLLSHASQVLVRKNETLVFMPLFEGMTRLTHLDTYNDDGLNWLTEAAHVYRSDTMEHYLSELTALHLAAPLGQALARCYWQAWYAAGQIRDSHVFYVDMHDKVIWTDKPSPVGFISALHEMRACLKQAFVHGRGGHAMFGQTYPADVHLSEVVVQIAQAFEQAVGPDIIQVIVTDREGLSVEVIRELARHNKAFVALLKANQYAGEADFERQGRFRRLYNPRTGQATHRVADADFGLAPDLVVRAALIYDLDHPDDLIAMITTVTRQQVADIREVVRWYDDRWNAQENSFRDQIAFVHLNVNFGLRAKQAVPDRRVARQIEELTAHFVAVTHKLETKLSQLTNLEQRWQSRIARYEHQTSEVLRPPKRQGSQADLRLAKRQQRLREYQQKHQQHLTRYLKQQTKLVHEIEDHRQEQSHVTLELTQLDPQAKFFEVQTEKDQIMAHLRIALHNSALWARDQYFSSAYRHTTPLKMSRAFFNQDGYYREMADCIVIALKPFSDPHLQREAIKACKRFNQHQITTLSGKLIRMTVIESI
jgi:hypothetical protein